MIRKYFRHFKKSDKDKIRWRSHEPTRIEALSDAVFAFAVSLLVFSLEVPKSSEELLKGMVNFIPFIFCFATILLIWYEQYKFFRRYGMHDVTTIILNGILIFVVLFYVYPLKFLYSSLLIDGGYTIRKEDFIPLTIVYNAGILGIYLIFVFMYGNAYSKREELNLTPIEIFETKSHLYAHLLPVFTGIVVIIIALLGGKYAQGAMAGWALMSFMGLFGARRNKLFKKKFGNIPMIEPHYGTEG